MNMNKVQNGKLYNDVIELVPKGTIFIFYTKSIFIGIWTLIKWLIHVVWSSIYQAKNKNSENPDYYDGYHDKPPSILVDNKIGRHSYVKLKGVKLHYVEAGSQGSPLVLLLHGFPDCWLGWRNQIDELSKFFRVIALDMKGFNDSDKPIWRQVYTPKKICEELRQFVFSFGYHTTTIIGHDIGAVIGWFFAHTNPDNIDRFICVSASHPNLIWNNLHPKAVINNSWLQFVQLPLLPEVDHSRSYSNFLEKCLKTSQAESNSTKTVVSLVRRPSENGFEKGFDVNWLDTYKYVFNRRSDWTGPFNYYRNFPFYRIKEGCIVRCPVLIITGNADNFCCLEAMVKSTEYCDNFLVKIIEGAGHWPHQQVPDEFNKIVLNFLVGRRANSEVRTHVEKNNKGLVGRMFGAVSSGVKIGSSMLDSMQQRTNDVIANALY
ncbi:epoxide hydrolase 4-like [Hermetia illucens]|uniref:epoxide hydrolase 4-like n=1 Tax=Hermetia illucens TaxID=343691 RepID=UPI0018CC2997|nr:epoxide hydrolase 4-like [Hermetia illucens]